MYKYISLILLLLSSMLLGQETAADSAKFALVTQKAGILAISITGIQSDEGFIMLAMSGDKTNYDDSENPEYKKIVLIKDGQSVVKFENLPYGEYAVKVYHDEDGDEELDKNFIGVPTEDYGFSNNPEASFGPASWDEAKFLFNEENTEITIDIE